MGVNWLKAIAGSSEPLVRFVSGTYVDNLIGLFQSDPTTNWKCLETAICIVATLAYNPESDQKVSCHCVHRGFYAELMEIVPLIRLV